MLETPQDESVVRWGNEGDSFVVLEVRTTEGLAMRRLTSVLEREVHQAYPT